LVQVRAAPEERSTGSLMFTGGPASVCKGGGPPLILFSLVLNCCVCQFLFLQYQYVLTLGYYLYNRLSPAISRLSLASCLSLSSAAGLEELRGHPEATRRRSSLVFRPPWLPPHGIEEVPPSAADHATSHGALRVEGFYPFQKLTSPLHKNKAFLLRLPSLHDGSGKVQPRTDDGPALAFSRWYEETSVMKCRSTASCTMCSTCSPPVD